MKLDRRTFLRGAGVAMALPLLDVAARGRCYACGQATHGLHQHAARSASGVVLPGEGGTGL